MMDKDDKQSDSKSLKSSLAENEAQQIARLRKVLMTAKKMLEGGEFYVVEKITDGRKSFESKPNSPHCKAKPKSSSTAPIIG